jgi:formylglycine-generating enzyme required for sulfatase activity
LSDDIDLQTVLVPAGEFLMGSTDTEREDELPQHLVRFERPFYIGRYPITQAQWRAVMGKNPSRYKGERLPVDHVSWFDCQEFCDALCKRQKRVFRLPTEAEWEYACRAGTTTRFAFGDTLTTDQANFVPLSAYMSTTFPEPEQRTTPVDRFPPNAWGIYDMHGNVNEWCEDVWHPSYKGAPCDGSAWLNGEDTTAFRVVRGGWCSATENVCRSTARQQLRADAGTANGEDENENEDADDGVAASFLRSLFTPYGFRVICELP